MTNTGFIPEGFQIPTQYNSVAGNSAVMTASVYTGMVKGQPFRFYQIEVLNAKKSTENRYETKDKIDMVEFYVDTKNKYAHRIDPQIFREHPEILADYSRWKEGRQSDVTEVKDWDAISYSEMGMLIAAGFHTVEQIVAADKERLMMIGTHWEDTLLKAKQHMESKHRAKRKDAAEEEAEELKASLAVSKAQIQDLAMMLEEYKKQLAASPVIQKNKKRKKAGVQNEDLKDKAE